MNIVEEFAGADLGDARLSKRLTAMATRLAAEPGKRFPQAMASSAEIEAAYRFLGNENVEPDAILAPHVQQSVTRIAQTPGTVIVAHDTTMVTFPTERDGLARSFEPGPARSFFMHTALAVAVGGARRTLGVLGALDACAHRAAASQENTSFRKAA